MESPEKISILYVDDEVNQDMAIKIIEGADPAKVAVEYPETVNLHVNAEMADKLGIDVSNLSVKE